MDLYHHSYVSIRYYCRWSEDQMTTNLSMIQKAIHSGNSAGILWVLVMESIFALVIFRQNLVNRVHSLAEILQSPASEPIPLRRGSELWVIREYGLPEWGQKSTKKGVLCIIRYLRLIHIKIELCALKKVSNSMSTKEQLFSRCVGSQKMPERTWVCEHTAHQSLRWIFERYKLHWGLHNEMVEGQVLRRHLRHHPHRPICYPATSHLHPKSFPSSPVDLEDPFDGHQHAFLGWRVLFWGPPGVLEEPYTVDRGCFMLKYVQ